jgi:uncharacterized protein
MRWFMDLAYPVMRLARSPKAVRAASGESASAADFEALRGARQALVVTFKRSGEPVPTPVNCGLSENGRLYFRTEPHVGKVKRIRSDARVLVAPCNMRGKPRGPLARGTARVLEAAESEPARAAVSGNWSRAMRPLERGLDRLGVPDVYVEVVPNVSEEAKEGKEAAR